MNIFFIIGLYLQSKLSLEPPIAKRVPRITEIHGEKLVDNYFWLRNKNDIDVIEYLEAENRYTDSVMEHTKELQKKLYNEMLGRIRQTDISAPVKIDDYYYYSRTEKGKQYSIHCRKKGSMDAEEEILIDENVLAKGLEYFSIGVYEVSPDHRFLAYSVDTDGSEIYTLYIKDLNTGTLLKDVITNTYYSLEWANDNKTIFYNILDETKRPYKIYRHVLGADPGEDVLVYYEEDKSFFASIAKTKSKDYIFFISESKTTSEVSYLKADEPTGEIKVIHPRQHEMEYYVDHHEDYFFILTNDSAKNFKLMKAPISNPVKESWEEVIPHRENVSLEHIETFKNHIVVFERENGLKNIRVLNTKDNETHYVTLPEPVYDFWQGDNPEYNTNLFRFEYTSLVTPRSVFDYNMDTKALDLKKQDEIPSGYDASQYQSERIFARASDATLIPISLVYKKGLEKTGNNPLYLYGYGSYGASTDPNFSTNRLSLLDRGFVFAIAHIRGGEEMGRYWYEQGKLLNKKNTFTDFIACAEHLIAEKYTSREKLVISGASAGGLLMGAVINMRPDLFHAVVAKVPFVDIINTMLDPSIPLTTAEYEEWGNPNDKEYYNYIKSYSPYDNVEAKDYPNILITASLYDTRVQYWEPAKWTAKLRALKTDSNILLLKTNMSAGHGGASGRYDYLKEIAFEYAFILSCLKIFD